MARRRLDAYYTPTHLTEMLLAEMPELRDMTVCDPCCGDGAILKCFGDALAFDIDPALGQTVRDARTGRYPTAEAFVTNPPFNQAAEIIPNLVEQSRVGAAEVVAALLRLTFLEPAQNRAAWLAANPPTRVYVCPRTSFTGDGKTDSVTCAWMIWEPEHGDGQVIKVLPRRGVA